MKQITCGTLSTISNVCIHTISVSNIISKIVYGACDAFNSIYIIKLVVPYHFYTLLPELLFIMVPIDSSAVLDSA